MTLKQHATLRKYLDRRRLPLRMFNSLLKVQKNACALCSEPLTIMVGNTIRCVLDHDPETGLIRGVLCTLCNEVLLQVERIPKPWAQTLAAYERKPYLWGTDIRAELDTATPAGDLLKKAKDGVVLLTPQRRRVLHTLACKGYRMKPTQAANLFQVDVSTIAHDYKMLAMG